MTDVKTAAADAGGNTGFPAEMVGAVRGDGTGGGDAAVAPAAETLRIHYKVLTGKVEGGAVWPVSASGTTPWIKTADGEATIEVVEHPVLRWHPGAKAYEAEVDPEGARTVTRDGVLCSGVRLLREVPWSEVGLVWEGEHTFEGGVHLALGDAEVSLKSGVLIARHGSKFTASGDARVHCREGASGRAFDSSVVSGVGDVLVVHHDHSKGYHRGPGVLAVGFGDSVITGHSCQVVLRERSRGYVHSCDVRAYDESSVALIAGKSRVDHERGVTVSWGLFSGRESTVEVLPEQRSEEGDGDEE